MTRDLRALAAAGSLLLASSAANAAFARARTSMEKLGYGSDKHLAVTISTRSHGSRA